MLKIVCAARCFSKLQVLIEIRRVFASKMHKIADNQLDTFRRVCDEIGMESGYKNKAKILENFFSKGSDQSGFKGDLLLWVQMLIPSASQRVYNLQNKQMLKLFSRIFACDQQEMQRDLEQEGDVSETLRKYFEMAEKVKAPRDSTLYLQEVEEFLLKLEQKTKEDEQTDLLRQLCKKATPTDLRMVIRLIKQDLRINARARHILDAFGPLAYPTYQSSQDLAAVVKQFGSKTKVKTALAPALKATRITGKVGIVQVMTPISPMLANACKSVDDAFKKSPTGLYSEIKYDGERVQIHKRGNEFKFFSRNLKPVMDHKIKRFHELIPKAFPGGGDLILDSEIILVDTKTGSLMPFGTLGAHKKKEFSHAEVCIFTFDCLLYNGENLTNVPFHKRRKILEENIKPIKSCVELSESKFLKTKNELSVMTAKVLKANLEGVVLKTPDGTYQPGKRGWLKVKKDYLFGGKMADTADLVVLGAWFGSGKKGGILSIFLMGCYDRNDGLWKTVTKVHSGLDDAENEHIHEQLTKLMERADPNRVPSWLLCKRALVPDYVAKAPKSMPVWEITGAEFTKSEAHTAAGISIRFPRITRLRADKTAEHANDLQYLQKLYEASKSDVNVDLLLADCNSEDMNGVADIEVKQNVTPKKERNKCMDADELKNNPTSKKELKNNTTPKKRGKQNVEDVKTEKNVTLKKLSKMFDEDDDMPSCSNTFKRKSDNEYLNEQPSCSKKLKTEVAKDKMNLPAKQLKLEFSGVKKQERKENCIFQDFVGYFDKSIVDKQYVTKFEENGGIVTKNAKEANIAFYATTHTELTLDDFRKNYKKTCRHLCVKWIHDSVKCKKCEYYPLYAVVLE